MLHISIFLTVLFLIGATVENKPDDVSHCTRSSPEPQCQQFNLTGLVSQIRSKQERQLQSSSGRIFKRQIGRGSLGGCGNSLLGQIMQHVVGPLQSVNRMKLGDIAKILRDSVQRATGKSHEILLGKGEMVTASHQMSESASCKLRIGEYYTTAYETPVVYSIAFSQRDQEMSNVDFGEKNGGSGYPGQAPFPLENPIAHLLNIEGHLLNIQGLAIAAGGGGGACFSGDSIVQTTEGPKLMSELKTGDEVLSVDEDMVSFSPIIMFLHREEDLEAKFRIITTVNGDSVKLTNQHLIHVIDCQDFRGLKVVSAKEVTLDHCLMVARLPDRKLTLSRVANITKVYERGVYAPLTATGDIIVNDVLASCHSHLAVRTLQNSFLRIYRSVSFVLPHSGGGIPFGIDFFTSALDLFIPFKAVIR